MLTESIPHVAWHADRTESHDVPYGVCISCRTECRMMPARHATPKKESHDVAYAMRMRCEMTCCLQKRQECAHRVSHVVRIWCAMR